MQRRAAREKILDTDRRGRSGPIRVRDVSTVSSSINITGPKPLNVSLVFTDEAHVTGMMKDFEGAPKIFKEIIALKRDGLTVTVTMVGEGDLIDNAVKVFGALLQEMMRPKDPEDSSSSTANDGRGAGTAGPPPRDP